VVVAYKTQLRQILLSSTVENFTSPALVIMLMLCSFSFILQAYPEWLRSQEGWCTALRTSSWYINMDMREADKANLDLRIQVCDHVLLCRDAVFKSCPKRVSID
jgi:hypothetical protein